MDATAKRLRMVRQAHLSSGTTRRTCWVPVEKRPTVGCLVTLRNSEEPERLWTVLSLSEPKDAALIHDDWNVGGVQSRR